MMKITGVQYCTISNAAHAVSEAAILAYYTESLSATAHHHHHNWMIDKMRELVAAFGDTLATTQPDDDQAARTDGKAKE
jgi:hypothetical protein